jgi:hypothetical protein
LGREFQIAEIGTQSKPDARDSPCVIGTALVEQKRQSSDVMMFFRNEDSGFCA